MLSQVEHYIPRCRDMYEIIQLISQKRRFITITGQSGIGKSTLLNILSGSILNYEGQVTYDNIDNKYIFLKFMSK